MPFKMFSAQDAMFLSKNSSPQEVSNAHPSFDDYILQAVSDAVIDAICIYAATDITLTLHPPMPYTAQEVFLVRYTLFSELKYKGFIISYPDKEVVIYMKWSQ